MKLKKNTTNKALEENKRKKIKILKKNRKKRDNIVNRIYKIRKRKI